MKFLLIISILLVFINCSDSNLSGSEAGNAKISAYLYLNNKTVLSNAKVDLYNINGDTLIITSLTDSTGLIEFLNLTSGTYQLYTDTIGEILLETIEATKSNTTTQNLYLAPTAYFKVNNNLLIDTSYTLSLLNTPVRNIKGIFLNDTSLIFANIPDGDFYPLFKKGKITVLLDTLLNFVSGDTNEISNSSIILSDSTFNDNFRTLSLNSKEIFLGGVSKGLLLSKSKIQYINCTSENGDISGDSITASFMNDSLLYIGTDSGITVFKNGIKLSNIFTGNVYSINKNSSDFIFTCSHFDGVGYFNNETYIAKLPDSTIAKNFLPASVYSYSDTSIIIGTLSKGLYSWTASSGLLLDTSYIGWNSLRINQIEVATDSSIWLVTPSSLRRKLPDSTWQMYHNDIGFYASITDNDGDLWFGANNGELYKWNGAELKLINNLESKIVSMTTDSVNNLYCLTEKKLFIFN